MYADNYTDVPKDCHAVHSLYSSMYMKSELLIASILYYYVVLINYVKWIWAHAVPTRCTVKKLAKIFPHI
jgi:hypothetical protein